MVKTSDINGENREPQRTPAICMKVTLKLIFTGRYNSTCFVMAS